MTIGQCPRSLVTESVREFVNLAKHAKHGHLPLAGGLMNQTRAFLDGLTEFQTDEALAENEAREAAEKE